jgi:hypothetical protein
MDLIVLVKALSISLRSGLKKKDRLNIIEMYRGTGSLLATNLLVKISVNLVSIFSVFLTIFNSVKHLIFF